MSIKNDYKKVQLSLLPWEALKSVAEVMQWAIEKPDPYPKDGWKLVQDGTNRYIDAALRHLGSRVAGEYVDSDSGKSHLAHAAASVLIALWHEVKSC